MATQEQKLLPFDTESQTNPKKKSTKRLLVFATIIIIGVAIGIIVWALTDKDSSSSSSPTLDIEWFYDVILSKNIDKTGLSHGIFYKQLDLIGPEQGLFRNCFDRNWTYYCNEPDTIQVSSGLTGQSRFVYNFAHSYQRTQDEAFLTAMYYGLDVLLIEFYDDLYGGYFNGLHKFKNGTYIAADDGKGSSMVWLIKAFSKCYEITRNETILNAVTQLYWLLKNNCSDHTGIGLKQYMSRNFSVEFFFDSRGERTENNMLHYFHSLLKLYSVYQLVGDETMRTEVANRVNDIYDFMMSLRRLAIFNETNSYTQLGEVEYLVLPAHYNSNWTAKEPITLNLNIGHNYEWCLFIRQFMDLEIIETNVTNIWNADNILNSCIDLSYNKNLKLIMNLPYTFTHWWVGMESMRPISYYYYSVTENSNNNNYTYLNYEKKELLQLMIDSLEGYRNIFYDPVYGGTYRDPLEGEFVKGIGSKTGYHVSEGCYDVMRFAKFEHEGLIT